MNKVWKGLTATALVLALAPIIGASTTGAAVAVEPTAVKAAAATTTVDPSCASDSTYDGGICKVDFSRLPDHPRPAGQVFPGPNPLVYPERPGHPVRNYTEQVAYMNAAHAASVAECKSYVPYSHRNDRAGWMNFCDSMPKPEVGYFQVKNVVTGEVR